MKFRFRKERAKKIIQPYEQNSKESLFPPLSTQAITEIKKMKTNMIKNAGLQKFIKQYFPEEPTEKTIKDLEEAELWHEIERFTSDYNVQEGVSCQLCLYQIAA